MVTTAFRDLRKAERDCPGILKQFRRIEARPKITTTCGITGRTITLCALRAKFCIRPLPPATS